jgi:hypothetical protein
MLGIWGLWLRTPHGAHSVYVLILIGSITTGIPLLVLAAQQRQRRPGAAPSDLADWHGLRDRHISADAAGSVFFLATAAVTTLGFAVLLGWLGASYQAGLPKGLYQRMPELSWVSFLLPSLLLGILTGALTADFALRLALGNRYGEYDLAFGGGSAGRPGDRGMPLLTVAVVVLVTGWVTFSLDSYSRFEEERAVISPFWGFGERSYQYSDVKAVVHSSHVRSRSREIEHPRYFIFFTDGRCWCNEDHGHPDQRVLDDDASLAAFVCRQAGKPLTRVRHIEEWTGN